MIHSERPCSKPCTTRLVWLLVIVCLALTGCPGNVYKDPYEQPKLDLNAQPMAEDKFWEIMDQAVAAEPTNRNKRFKKLVEILKGKSEEELKGFKLAYREQIDRLMNAEVLAMFIIAVRMDDREAFMYYRDQLVGDGRERFEEVMADPQTILKDIYNGVSLDINDYSYYMAGDFTLQQKTEDPLAGIWVPFDLKKEPSGEPVDIADEEMIAREYPEMYEFIQRRNRLEEKELFGGN